MPADILTRATCLTAVLIVLTGCGFVVPGTPGHEPPEAGNYNPVAMERNSSGR